jgi:hypothetical protein
MLVKGKGVRYSSCSEMSFQGRGWYWLIGADDGRLWMLLFDSSSDDGGAAARWFIRVVGVALGWPLMLLGVEGWCE